MIARPDARHHQDAEDHEQHAADDVDDADVAAQEPDRARRPAEPEGDQDERDAEARASTRARAGLPGPGSPKFHDIARIAPRVGPMHGAQPMPSARPSSGAPIRPTLPRTCGLNGALREPEESDEDQAEQDDDDAHDARDRVGVLDEEPTDRAAEDVDRHEHDGETGDEQEHPDQQPATGRLGVSRHRASDGSAGCRRDPTERRRRTRATAPTVGLPRRDRSPDEPEVSGHERQHARREERHEAREHRDRQGEPERAVGDDRAGVHEAPRARRARAWSGSRHPEAGR